MLMEKTETPTQIKSVASYWHLLIVVGVLVLQSLRGLHQSSILRSMPNPDRLTLYWRTMLFEWIIFAIVIAGVWLRRASLSDVLGERWRSLQQFARDFGIGVGFLLLTIVVTSVAGSHGSGNDKMVRFLLPHTHSEMLAWVVLSLTAGICEETLFRGYLQKQFAALKQNLYAGILISGLGFGAAHLYQGWGHASVIAVLGIMAGALAQWRGTVRPGMIAHTLQDVLGGFVNH